MRRERKSDLVSERLLRGHHHVTVGKENYFLSADGYLMPREEGPAAPDSEYFKQSRKYDSGPPTATTKKETGPPVVGSPSRACSVPSESEHALEIIRWRMFFSANRCPLSPNMR